MNPRVLLLDDDRTFADLAAEALRREGFIPEVVRSITRAEQLLQHESFDLALIDRRLPDGDGLSLVPKLQATQPGAPVIMVTAYGDVQSAVEALKSGAVDYVVKPVHLADLVMKAKQACERSTLKARLDLAESKESSAIDVLTESKSAAMREVFGLLDRLAAVPKTPVLMLGETGSGKEVAARYLHRKSFGDAAPFIQLNCAAIPDTLFESTLFGHEKGAFTGASQAQRGLIEIADGGTLFLDEIGDMPLALQAKLLTFLDSGRFRRMGAERERNTDLRVVAATHRSLEKEVADGRFREDLFFRLAVLQVRIPPLRERREDIVPLAEFFLGKLSKDVARPTPALSPEACERLRAYPFPGNVRELRNVIERALVLEVSPVLRLANLEVTAPRGGGVPGCFPVEPPFPTLAEMESRYVKHVVAALGGRKGDAAAVLGISHPTLTKKLGEKGD